MRFGCYISLKNGFILESKAAHFRSMAKSAAKKFLAPHCMPLHSHFALRLCQDCTRRALRRQLLKSFMFGAKGKSPPKLRFGENCVNHSPVDNK